MFYVAVCSEAFIYCFAGEYLSIKVIKNVYKYIEISKWSIFYYIFFIMVISNITNIDLCIFFILF